MTIVPCPGAAPTMNRCIDVVEVGIDDMRNGTLRAMIVAWLASGCGGGENLIGPPADGSAPCGQQPGSVGDGAACVPELPACWRPTWKPPKAPVPHACTEAQIMEDIAKCWGDTADPDCDVFERDPANGVCLECIYSIEDDPRHGAVVFLNSRRVRANEAGCISLVDGDDSPNGCGAKLQASQQCSAASCAQCSANRDAYNDCWDQTFSSTCVFVHTDAVCWRRPIYAVCTRYNTFQESFAAMARIFCVDGLSGGPGLDSGTERAAQPNAEGP